MAKRPIYYDTETTGIKAEKDRIIEIAAYDPERDQTFEALINPGIPIPPEATAIHKITNEMVAEAPSSDQVLDRFKTFCEGEVVLIAHNNDNFDQQFLKWEFQRLGQEMPSWIFLDTLKWARKYRPDLPRHTLQYLREIYGIPANNAHRALDDVIVLHRVFSLLLDDLSIEQAIQLLSVRRKLDRMPFGKHQGKPLAEIPKDYIQWLVKSGAFEKAENEELRKQFEEIGLLSS